MSSFGANPPPGQEWQVGKTAATIKFVLEAEVEMYRRPDMTNGEGYTLLMLVDRLKSGEESLLEEETVDAWLMKLRTANQTRDEPPRRSFGAQPPAEFAWQMGKTVATLDFVREAEHALATQTDLEPDERYKLEAKIVRLKDGSESLGDDETVDAWLERLRDHYP